MMRRLLYNFNLLYQDFLDLEPNLEMRVVEKVREIRKLPEFPSEISIENVSSYVLLTGDRDPRSHETLRLFYRDYACPFQAKLSLNLDRSPEEYSRNASFVRKCLSFPTSFSFELGNYVEEQTESETLGALVGCGLGLATLAGIVYSFYQSLVLGSLVAAPFLVFYVFVNSQWQNIVDRSVEKNTLPISTFEYLETVNILSGVSKAFR